MAKLYVGVVIHGSPEYVTPGLDSLLNSELDFPTKFVLLDNGSPNPGDIKQIFDSVNRDYSHLAETHVSLENKGCSGGWNFCIRKAYEDPEFEWIILAGPDIIVHKKTLSNLVHRYLRGGVDLTSGVDVSYDQPMPEPVEQEVFGANFSLIMLPKALIDVVGLFDENIWPAYFEDNDYHFRAVLANKGNGVWTWLAPFRHKRSLTVQTYSQISQHFAKNQSYFIAKWGGLPNDVLQKNDALREGWKKYENPHNP